MRADDLLCDKKMYERLMSHSIVISGKVVNLNKLQDLALISQSIFDRVVDE